MRTDRRAEGIDALNCAIAELAAQSRRQLSAFIAAPMPALWNSPACVETLRQFLTERGQREVRLLFAQPETLARDCGALVALAQRLPSRLRLHRADADFTLPASQSVVFAEDGHALLFDSGTHPAATTLSDEPGITRPLAERFHAAWERGQPLDELRSLGI